MGELFTIQFWKNTTELAVRGASMCGLTAMGGSSIDAWHLDWKAILGFAASGAVFSLLASLASVDLGAKGSPLLTNRAPTQP